MRLIAVVGCSCPYLTGVGKTQLTTSIGPRQSDRAIQRSELFVLFTPPIHYADYRCHAPTSRRDGHESETASCTRLCLGGKADQTECHSCSSTGFCFFLSLLAMPQIIYSPYQQHGRRRHPVCLTGDLRDRCASMTKWRIDKP